jgi:hypothetical protein
MYISCKTLWDAGITKDQVSCCGSCHAEAEILPDYDLIEICEDEIHPNLRFFEAKVIGHVCCSVSNWLDKSGKRAELLKQVYEMEYVE